MALVIPSPLIEYMSGKVGSIVCYRRWNKQYARQHVKQRESNTEAQKTMRHTFADAVKSWQVLIKNEKDKFNRRARHLNMSGYNLYISQYMKKSISAVRKASGIASSSLMLRFPSVSPSLHVRFTEPNPFIHPHYSPG
jgi:hypothetical protein